MPSRKQLTETPARSMASRTRAYGGARPLNGAVGKSLRRHLPAQCHCVSNLRRRIPAQYRRVSSLRRRQPARWRREQGLLGPVEGQPPANPPSLPPFSEESWEGGLFPSPGKEASRRAKVKNGASSVPQAGCRGRSPRRGYSESPCSEKRRRAAPAGNNPSHLGLTAVGAMTGL